MIIKKIMMGLLIMLLSGLSTSSFFLNDYLTKIIIKNEHTESQLNFAIAHNNFSALNFMWKNAILHSEQWLYYGKEVAKTQGEAAYQLAVYYQTKPDPEPKKMIFWYENAIRLQYSKASIALAQYYFQRDKLAMATQIITLVPIEELTNLKVSAIVLKINIAINLGNVAIVNKLIEQYMALLQKTEAGQLLLADIYRYQVLFSVSPTSHVKILSPSCDNSIQLFATNLKHLKRLEKIITTFKEQSLSHAVCFTPIRYIPINELDCNNNSKRAITCNEIQWELTAKTVNTRYVGLMLPKGGANVHLGMLYFDAQDSVDVFAHEISHLLGFVDEYALTPKHSICQQPQQEIFSQNISVLKNRYQGDRKAVRVKVLKQLAWGEYINDNTPILQEVVGVTGEELWQLGTPKEFSHQIGVFHAKTCDNSLASYNNFSAFKSVSQRTKLQYFALNFPEIYRKLLQEKLMEYRMPSFHYNIALAYFNQSATNNKFIEQAHYWMEKAKIWSDNVEKKGGF